MKYGQGSRVGHRHSILAITTRTVAGAHTGGQRGLASPCGVRSYVVWEPQTLNPVREDS